jgi:hypothetical protein
MRQAWGRNASILLDQARLDTRSLQQGPPERLTPPAGCPNFRRQFAQFVLLAILGGRCSLRWTSTPRPRFLPGRSPPPCKDPAHPIKGRPASCSVVPTVGRRSATTRCRRPSRSVASNAMRNLPGRLTATALLGLGVLHAAWGAGSAVPFRDRNDLADAVVGTIEVPPPLACYTVTGALVAAAALVLGVPRGRPSLRRVGLFGVTAVLSGRGVLGLAGATRLVSPGSTSDRFRRLDRRLYSPLCLALAAGSWSASRTASQ